MADIVGPPRCSHHVMILGPHFETDKAWGCWLCREPEFSKATNGFHTPKRGTHEEGVLRANGHTVGCCTRCDSAYHFVEGKKWVCSECGTAYEPPKRMRIPENGNNAN
jgi:hypothetical protein